MFFTIFCYDYGSYYYAEEKLVANVDSIKKIVSHELGITDIIKNKLLSENIYLMYDNPNGNVGEIFEFIASTKYSLLLTRQEKVIKIRIVVLLGY